MVTLQTVDGGAIVVGQLTTVSTVTLTVAGGTIPISDPFYAALTGKTSAGSNFVRTFTDVLVMYVPPAGSARTRAAARRGARRHLGDRRVTAP